MKTYAFVALNKTVLESSRDAELRYESMAWYLKPVQEVA